MVGPSVTVSVIMNGYNCERYLREAIDSVFAQTFTDWEIVFYDNSSTDATAQIAQSYPEKLKYFKSKENVPLGAARNAALSHAKGEYIAFLDCDDLWCPQKLEKQVAKMQANLQAGLVYSDASFFFENGRSFRVFPKGNAPQGKIFATLLRRYSLPMPTILVRKSALDQVGERFDERFNMVEDADLFMRIAYYCPVECVNEVLAKRRMHEESWTSSKKGLFPKEEEMLLEKFSLLWPTFKDEFKSEIAIRRAIISYQYAVLDWEKGKSVDARHRMAPHLRTFKKVWIPYLFSYLPYPFYQKFKCLYKTITAPLVGSVDYQSF